jgi:hypothetical protein
VEICGQCGKEIKKRGYFARGENFCECDERIILEERRLSVEQQTRIVACCGRKGSGKSTLARAILEQCPRLFIYDTMGEHRWTPDSFDQLDQAIIYLMESYSYGEFQARYIPESDDEEEKDFSEVCNTIYEQGNVLFAIEEVVMLGCSPGYAPPKFKRLMRLGRHRNVDMLYTTQRIGECPRALTAATDTFILFAHSEPRDLDAISERCGPEVARKVASFTGHEFLIWDVNKKAVISTVDCGAIIAAITSPQFQPVVLEPKQLNA